MHYVFSQHVQIWGFRLALVLHAKDSFVTQGAFCNAMTRENYKMNYQSHVATEAVRQAKCKCCSTHPCPLLSVKHKHRQFVNFNEPTDNSLAPVFTSAGTMMLNVDPTTTSRASFRALSPMSCSMGSCSCASATALLLKTTEMGSQVGDNNSVTQPLSLLKPTHSQVSRTRRALLLLVLVCGSRYCHRQWTSANTSYKRMQSVGRRKV